MLSLWSIFPAKVRRLYDVANVFSSLNLIEKVKYIPINIHRAHVCKLKFSFYFLLITSCDFLNDLQIRHSESGKPAYRWLGWKGKLKNGFDTASEINEPKKRVFGSDITNYNSKRNKTNSVVGWKSSKETSVRMHNKLVDLEHEYDENELKQHPRHKSTGIDFGPFAPVSVLKARDAAFKNVKQVQDMESLASTYRPQYHNQGTLTILMHQFRWSTFGLCMKKW